MARATLATVKRITFDNLGLTNQTSGYGNLQTNQRFLTGYIDDAISLADIWITKVLYTNKQDNLLTELYETQTLENSDTINNNYGIVKVEYDINDGLGTFQRAIEIDYDMYERLIEGGIYNTSTYTGYYAIQDGKLYGVSNTDDFKITYINLTHSSSLSALKSPAGFEGVIANLASAMLLMKRNDNPSQAQFYYNLVKEFMQQYLLPENNIPVMVDFK